MQTARFSDAQIVSILKQAEIAEWRVKLTTAWQGIENAREGATGGPGGLVCVFCICATCKAMSGTINALTGSTASLN